MNEEEPGYAIVFTTAGTVDAAGAIARELVGRRLAACVNVVQGVRSVYRWQGAVHDDAETLLVIKTTTGRFEALRRAIREIHPYEIPEIVMIPVSDGDAAYLSWIDRSLESD